jgi:alkaline phosphatase D
MVAIILIVAVQQFFGEVQIEGRSGAMTVLLKDMTGATLWQRTLEPDTA